MHTRILFTLLLFSLPVLNIFSQSYFARDYPAYPYHTPSQTYFNPNGGYSVTFDQITQMVVNNPTPTKLFRMNGQGDILQSYSYTGEGSVRFQMILGNNGKHWLNWLNHSEAITLDSSFIASKDSLRLTYLDKDLNLIWDRRYSLGTSPTEGVRPTAIFHEADGVLIAGWIDLDQSPSAHQGNFLLKIDTSGQLLWSKRYGYLEGKLPIPQTLLRLQNGDIAMNGMTDDLGVVNGNEVFFWKFNSMGDSITGQVGSPNGGEPSFTNAGNMLEEANGNIAFYTSFYWPDPFAGIHAWSIKWLWDSSSGEMQIQSTLLPGSDPVGNQTISIGSQTWHLYDTDNGMILFMPGGPAHIVRHPDYPTSLHQTAKKTIFDPMPFQHNFDYSPTGDVVIGCAAPPFSAPADSLIPIIILTNLAGATSVAENDPSLFNLEVYPNPNSGAFNLKLEGNHIPDLEGKVFDIHGTEVGAFNIRNNTEVDLMGLVPGLYLMEVTSRGKRLFLKKILVQ